MTRSNFSRLRLSETGEASQKTDPVNEIQKAEEIINDPKKANDFFNNHEFKEIAKKIAEQYNRQYKIAIDANYVVSKAYIACSSNDWARLRIFRGEIPLKFWVMRIGSQLTHESLIEEKYIPDVQKESVSAYRLTIRSIKDVTIRQSIVDLVGIEEIHDVLLLYYVDKLKEDAIIDIMGSKEKFKNLLRQGQNLLIQILLSTQSQYAELALSRKKQVSPETRWNDAFDRIDDDQTDFLNVFHKVLQDIYKSDDKKGNFDRFIDDMVKRRHWTPRREYVWRERFYHNTCSKKLAAELGVTVGWVDNNVSDANADFRKALRHWWESI